MTTSIFTERYRVSYNISLQIISCTPSMYVLDQSEFIVCSNMENSIDVKRVKRQQSTKIVYVLVKGIRHGLT